MRPKCYAVDLDYTSVHFTGGLDGLYAIFLRRGVPEEVVKQSYARVVQNGFIIRELVRRVKLDCAANPRATLPDESDINAEFAEWLACSLKPYRDSVEVLNRWRKQAPVAIVTFGVPEYQMSKIAAVGVPYNEFHATQSAGGKTKILRHLLRKCGPPIVFIDDAPQELDMVRDADIAESQIVTIRMLRDDSPYIGDPSVYVHRHAATLIYADKLIRLIP